MQKLYLQLQNLKRTDKYSLLLIAAVAVCLAIKFLAIDPLQNRVQLTQNLLTEEQQRLVNYRSFAEEYRNYEVFTAEQAQAAEAAYKLLSEEITAAELIREYSELAGKYNLHVQSIKPVPPQKQSKKAYETLTLKIILNGNFYKTATFLDELQNGGRLVTVSNAVMERNTEGLPGSVTLTANLTAYALK